jgi:hypothetical protein
MRRWGASRHCPSCFPPSPALPGSVCSQLQPDRCDSQAAEWPDQPYRLLATPAVRSAGASVRVADPQQHGIIGRTRLFPHSANMP